MFNRLNKSTLSITIRKIFTASVFFACACLFSPIPVFADSIDMTQSGINFNTVSDFASGLSGAYEDIFLQQKEKTNIANNNKSAANVVTDQLKLIRVGFSNIQTATGLSVLASEDLYEDEDADVVASVIGQALVYPNPFRQSSDFGAELGYRLSKDMDMQIHIYNMMSQLVLKRTFNAGSVGARKGYNKLQINKDTFDGRLLSSGVYFYLLVHDGDVLARGKMAVKP
jgi:hypothetical protein